MALDFTSATGNLFNRLGQIFGAMEGVETWQNTTLPSLYSGIFDEYDAPADRELIGGMATQRETNVTAGDNIKNQLRTFAENTLIDMVDTDNPLTAKTTEAALIELIAQMESQSASVDASAVGISDSADAVNNGDGELVTATADGEATTLENILAEDIVVECISDSQPGTGGLTEGSEVFRAKGEAPIGKLSNQWPKGSGGSTRVVVANPGVDNTNANLLTNGDFEAFTTNTPDSWTVRTGSAGTDILEETTAVYKGASALEFVGDGATLSRISQQLRLVGTTVGLLKPKTRYALGVWTSVDSAPAAGTLVVALREGTGAADTVVGSALTIDLTAETATYAFHSVSFVTPAVIPDAIHIHIQLTVALTTSRHAFIDHMALAPMVQHQNGPFIAIFPGATKFIVGDKFTVTPTNDRAGKFQEWFDRAFDMTTKGLVLPSNGAGSETILDSLVA